jgi:hypothetical protein
MKTLLIKTIIINKIKKFEFICIKNFKSVIILNNQYL